MCSWLQEAGHSGLLVAVFGAVQEQDKPAVSRMKHSAATPLAVALDVDAWVRGSSADRSGRDLPVSTWLGLHGFRTVSAGPRDQLAAVWQELGRTGDRAPGRHPATQPHEEAVS